MSLNIYLKFLFFKNTFRCNSSGNKTIRGCALFYFLFKNDRKRKKLKNIQVLTYS